jgi:hypothetical protein
LDATTGFHHNRKMILDSQVHTRHLLPPGSDQDGLPHFYGRGDPNDPATVVQHTTTQGIYKRRNEKGGANAVRLAHVLVVFLFEAWETEFRGRIASALGLKPKEVTIPVMGDLRLLRNEILHHRGVLTEDTCRGLTVLSVGPVGSAVGIKEQEVEALIHHVKAGLDAFVVSRGAPDPKHRTLWHLT